MAGTALADSTGTHFTRRWCHWIVHSSFPSLQLRSLWIILQEGRRVQCAHHHCHTAQKEGECAVCTSSLFTQDRRKGVCSVHIINITQDRTSGGEPCFVVLAAYTVSVRLSHWVCSCSLNYKVSPSFLPSSPPPSISPTPMLLCFWMLVRPPWAWGLTFSILLFFFRASLGFYHFIKFFPESLLPFCSSASLWLITFSSPSVLWIAHRLISVLRTWSSVICHLHLSFPSDQSASMLTSFRVSGHIHSQLRNACET